MKNKNVVVLNPKSYKSFGLSNALKPLACILAICNSWVVSNNNNNNNNNNNISYNNNNSNNNNIS